MAIWFFVGLSAFLPIINLDSFCSYLAFIADDVVDILIVMLIFACCTRIYFIVRGSLYRYIATSEDRSEVGQCLTESAGRIEELKRKERSLACAVFIIIAIYLGCWFPILVLRNLDKSCNRHDLQRFASLFVALHMLLNPLAYVLCTKKFRLSLWTI